MSTRREILKMVSAVAGLIFALPSVSRAAKKLAIPLDKVEKLNLVGGSAYLKIRDMEILFIRDSENSIKALNPICTHKKCTVEHDAEIKMLVCPCHGSVYDLNGKVAKGPAEKDLSTYEATLSDGKIVLTVEE